MSQNEVKIAGNRTLHKTWSVTETTKRAHTCLVPRAGMSAKGKARSGGVQACQSSLWDLLDLNLQRYIIELALESRRSEAQERFLSISSTCDKMALGDVDKDNFLSLATLAKQHAVFKLKQVMLEIRADERRLLGPDPRKKD